ncbi:MAG: hypothetical protein IPM29_27810 [Planctomycetes bacterium]|nr:hypothetical protein [Planctomycetota bacterium]
MFLGSTTVERHLAQSLRDYAGRLNLALFCLGRGRDSYRFDLAGDAVAWHVKLCHVPRLPHRLRARATGNLPTDRSREFAGATSVFVGLSPPAAAEHGTLEVHVRRRSSGEEAVVEFDLDARAASPGCYTR